MKVTTFVILQSQNLKNVRLLQKGKIYLFEIQSNPNLNIVVTNKIEYWGGLPLPLAVYVRMAPDLFIRVYITIQKISRTLDTKKYSSTKLSKAIFPLI
jgi:hypothetical protein